MPSSYREVFRSLAQRELLLPYLRNAVLSKNWPLKYLIEVDSSPYYGLDEDGTPDGYFHPSTHPLMGARQLYYLFHPDHRDKVLPEERDVQDEMGLAMGSALHAVVQTQFVQSGLLEESDVEVEYINHDHHVRGRIDFIIHHPIGAKVVTEFKTRNSRAFSFQKEILPEWDAQLSLALDHAGESSGVLLMLESGYPYRMKEFKVPRNDALLSEVYAKFDLVRESIEMNTPPPHCCARDSLEMKKCPARYQCWLRDKVVR